MDKFKEKLRWFFVLRKPWYARWWLWLLVLFLVVGIPVLINEAYKCGNSTGKGCFTLWEAKDVLSYYGSVLSFIGTVALGALALYQNKVLSDKNEELTEKLQAEKIESEHEMQKNADKKASKRQACDNYAASKRDRRGTN